MHSDGWVFVGIAGVCSLILMHVCAPLAWIGWILTVWCAYFFRMPKRIPPEHGDWIVSPADGRVVLIEQVNSPTHTDENPDTVWRVSIFLNIFDVHVNYVPFDGVVKDVSYHAGQFINASFDKASTLNERNVITMELAHGQVMSFVQIAGWVARRIRCDIKVGDAVKRGEPFGLIRFGSRVDLYLPHGVEPLVRVGQTMVAGETLIGKAQYEQGQA